MSSQTIRSTQEPGRLGIAFLTALALHGAVLGTLTLWRSSKTDSAPGEQEITIDLAPAMEETVSVVPAEMSAMAAPPIELEPVPLEPETVEPLPPEDVTATQPEEAAELPEPQETTEVPPVEAEMATEPVVALPSPETVIAKPLEEPPPSKPKPKPEKKSPPREHLERKSPPHRISIQQPQTPSEARAGQASGSRENTRGAAASADPSVLNRYVASLAAALRNRLRYPDVARSQGVGGVATLRFTMDRSGRIVSSSVVQSAGHPALDQAARAAASPGSLLPPAPAALPQQQFTVSVPLRFNLR